MQTNESTRIEKLRAFIALNPADSFSRHALAMEYVKLGDDASARHQLETLLEKDPAYVGSYYHLGKILERAGELTMAADIYKKGISMAEIAGERHAAGELRAALLNCED